MAAVELDVPRLASFCSLPESSITAALDAPTVELVKTILESISAKARQFDETQSQQLKLTVELENAIRGGDAKHRALKSSLEKAQRDASDLRQNVQEEGNVIMMHDLLNLIGGIQQNQDWPLKQSFRR